MRDRGSVSFMVPVRQGFDRKTYGTQPESGLRRGGQCRLSSIMESEPANPLISGRASEARETLRVGPETSMAHALRQADTPPIGDASRRAARAAGGADPPRVPAAPRLACMGTTLSAASPAKIAANDNAPQPGVRVPRPSTLGGAGLVKQPTRQ